MNCHLNCPFVPRQFFLIFGILQKKKNVDRSSTFLFVSWDSRYSRDLPLSSDDKIFIFQARIEVEGKTGRGGTTKFGDFS